MLGFMGFVVKASMDYFRMGPNIITSHLSIICDHTYCITESYFTRYNDIPGLFASVWMSTHRYEIVQFTEQLILRHIFSLDLVLIIKDLLQVSGCLISSLIYP